MRPYLEYSDLDELLAELHETRRKRAIGIIGVEGYSTSGKSWLAGAINGRLGYTVISTDRFLRKGCKTKRYIDCLDSRALKAAVSSGVKPIVIEGLALADSLEAIDAVADLTIYCKRISHAGLWPDNLAYYVTEGLPKPDLSMIDHWAVEYHVRTNPMARADLVFRWVER